MGKDEMPGLVSVFLDEIDGAVAKIQTAANAAEDDLHFLKGCALTFGFSGLAALASDGEASLNDYRLTPVGSLFECNSRY